MGISKEWRSARESLPPTGLRGQDRTSNLFWLNPTASHQASEFLNIISESRDWGVKEQSGPGRTNWEHPQAALHVSIHTHELYKWTRSDYAQLHQRRWHHHQMLKAVPRFPWHVDGNSCACRPAQETWACWLNEPTENKQENKLKSRSESWVDGPGSEQSWRRCWLSLWVKERTLQTASDPAHTFLTPSSLTLPSPFSGLDYSQLWLLWLFKVSLPSVFMLQSIPTRSP